MVEVEGKTDGDGRDGTGELPLALTTDFPILSGFLLFDTNNLELAFLGGINLVNIGVFENESLEAKINHLNTTENDDNQADGGEKIEIEQAEIYFHDITIPRRARDRRNRTALLG